MTKQTDADLIRDLRSDADFLEVNTGFKCMAMRRAAARLSELTQPAPQDETQQPTFFVQCDGSDVSVYQRRADDTPLLVHREKLPAQPVPLALSAENAAAWQFAAKVAAKSGDAVVSPVPAGTILAVDKLLRKRVQRLTDEQIDKILEQQRMRWATSPPTYEFAQAFARAIEAKLIGEGAK